MLWHVSLTDDSARFEFKLYKPQDCFIRIINGDEFYKAGCFAVQADLS